MTAIRIAVASTPLTATLEEAVPAAVAAVEEAWAPQRNAQTEREPVDIH